MVLMLVTIILVATTLAHIAIITISMLIHIISMAVTSMVIVIMTLVMAMCPMDIMQVVRQQIIVITEAIIVLHMV